MKEELIKFKDVVIPEGTELTLKTMFIAKETLLHTYYEKGQLEFNWKLSDLNSRHTQNWVRESMGCLIEEIFEAKEVLDETIEKPIAYYLTSSSETQVFKLEESKLQIREEQADVMHFWVEVLLFSGITHGDIQEYYYELFRERNYPEHLNNDPLQQIFWFARDINIQVNHLPRSTNRYFNLPLLELSLENKANELLLSSLKHLNIARNKLKNKYWKSQDIDTNIEEYTHNLMEAFINYTLYLDLLGFTAETLSTDYLKKNIINQERQQKGW